MSKEKALKLFTEGGFNCAQAVFAAFCDGYGLDELTALRIAAAAGGGFRCGETCGAFAGAMFIVGLKHGQTVPGDLVAKNACNAKAVELASRFKTAHKSIICRELLGCDTSTPEGKNYFIEQNLHSTVCAGLIESAADILEELGYA